MAAACPETQAKAIAQAFRDAQGEVDVATKADLRELEHRLKAALAEVKADTIKWVAGFLLAQAALAPLVNTYDRRAAPHSTCGLCDPRGRVPDRLRGQMGRAQVGGGLALAQLSLLVGVLLKLL